MLCRLKVFIIKFLNSLLHEELRNKLSMLNVQYTCKLFYQELMGKKIDFHLTLIFLQLCLKRAAVMLHQEAIHALCISCPLQCLEFFRLYRDMATDVNIALTRVCLYPRVLSETYRLDNWLINFHLAVLECYTYLQGTPDKRQ